MSYQPFDEKTLGLSSEGNSLKAAYVVLENGKVHVKKLFVIPLALPESEAIVKPLYMDPEEKELKQLADIALTVSGLNASDLLVRRMRIKLTKEKDIDEAFAFQAEPLLPYPVDTAILDKITVEKQEGTTLLVLLSAKKETIQKHLEFWQDQGIDPEVVSADPEACAAFASTFFDPSPAQFVVHVGRFSSFALLLREGKLLSCHAIAKGWESLYQALSEDVREKQPSPDEFFEMDQNAISLFTRLKQAQSELLLAIQWNYLAQIKETKLKDPPHLCVIGEGANMPSFSALLARELKLPLENLKIPDSHLSCQDACSFAIPIGLALTGQPRFKSPISFRRGGLAYATPWKRFKRPLYMYAGLTLLLASALYLFGLSYLHFKEDGLKQRYLSLLSLAQKPYEQFERHVETKYPSGSDTLPLKDLNSDALLLRLDTLEREIRAMPDTFPLLPNTPRVSDTLAWLSTHPVLACSEGECPAFSIDSFHYSIVKRPELNKKSEKYQVKVDIEFTTSSPRLAREFHDALITPNDFIDPKGEIKWNATKGKYVTSFFLKDRTVYPPPLKEAR
jgi:type IV pilus assembly protein PilM